MTAHARSRHSAPMRAPSPRRLPLLALLLGAPALACGGDTDTTSAGSSSSGGSTGDTDTTTGAAASTTGTSTADTTTGGVDEPPFNLDRDNIRLLPFAVRLNRLSLLLDLPESDPAFTVMLARRYDLGDYDFAKGIHPDLTWTTSRMANWVAAVRPLCNSPAMKERYPEFPLDLAALMGDAYGFPPAPVDLEVYESLLGDANLDEATRYETVCLAVLSQLEFVAL